MSSNSAVYLVSEKARPLEVRSAPYPKPGAHQLVVRVRALAINPLDGMLQQTAFMPLKYPKVLGEDVSGEVVEVGASVTRFKVGQRVCGCPTGAFDSDAESGFQEYSVLNDNMAAPIPDSMAYERATVFPISVCTAACGLFLKDFLGMQYPSVNPKSTGKTLVVYGGSTATGVNGILLALAAGYEVIATASPHNFDYIKKLGASEVFDYKSPTCAGDMIKALEGKEVAGALDCIGWHGANQLVAKVLAASRGTKFIAQTQHVEGEKEGGVQGKMIFAMLLKDNAEAAKAVWEDFMPQAMAEARWIAAPEPLVVGQGLDKVQQAVDACAGVSAQKVVVTL